MRFLTLEQLARVACWTVAQFSRAGEKESFDVRRANAVLEDVGRSVVRANDGDELVTAVTRLICSIAEHGPLERLNAPLALAAAIAFASINGKDFRLPDSVDDLNLSDSSAVRAAVEAWTVDASSTAQLSFLETTTHHINLADDGVRAYVVTPLTELAPEDRKWTAIRSGIIAATLEEFGINVHEPCKHTDPEADPDIPPANVHRTDYDEVLNADVVVGLGDRPSWGGGKEMAWADGNMAPVAILLNPARRLSRLITGTTGRLTEKVVDDASFPGAIREFVIENEHLLRMHAALRSDRNRLFGRSAELIRVASKHASLDSPSLLTAERIREIGCSSHHFANASIEQLLTVATALDIPLNDLLRPLLAESEGATKTASDWAAFDQVELVTLGNAARMLKWNAEEVLLRLQRAHRLRRRVGTRRQTFRTVEDWIAIG